MDPIPQTPTEPRDYAALNLVWGGLVAALLAGTRRGGAQAPPVTELPVLGLASFSLSKALAKEKVGAWVRQPVVEEEHGGEKRPRGHGLQYALGELVTCTRCLGTWSSLAIVALRVARPREGRIVATVLATAALNDWLQSGFSLAASKANATAAGAEGGSAEARLAAVKASRTAGG